MSRYNEGDMKRVLETIARLQGDNEKLRELVRRLYNMANFCRNCPDTERCDLDIEWLGCTVADPIKADMKELGVEI